ncbi:MAG: hypothetical protein KatS3mg001_212 [Candidatus Pacearchaeota archaeon]|nr:MAG: hypothetical protein KatS3mg001_212 [Candidatus Pacearchaeota archaeon]
MAQATELEENFLEESLDELEREFSFLFEKTLRLEQELELLLN